MDAINFSIERAGSPRDKKGSLVKFSDSDISVVG
jgi:hypothetical protein